ncbi:Serine/threonine-protein phosphatase 4 regulatory subunit 1 [Bulinus truncatus]|nr:Serine/threonine-protein phosphatase 4 regulatory subunit 1 [Bulinus truncatus]
MADLEFYQDDPDENTEDDYGFEGSLGEVEDLTPLQRLEKYLDSDNIFNRQMLARSLLDTLRAVYDSEDSCVSVLDAMSRLSEDPEPSVRSELMEQVPHIAVYCQESRLAFDNAIPNYILPMVVRYLNDSNSQVRKTSQAALLVLLEQGLVEKNDIEQQVVHVILELASPESLDDYRSEAAALMSKMAPLLGKEITERHFLPRFSEMCTDPLFHVRKVCAANFGEVATVVGVKNCEEVLLPKFYYLCEDGVWGVRKACAECFMTVSCACSLETRKNELANLFVNLLCDQSRWVRMSAFQQLGPFISTFADAESTGLFVNEDGSLSFKNVNSLDGDLVSCVATSIEKVNIDTDLSGILQFKSVDCSSFIRDSDAQCELQDKFNIGATDVSNNSRMQDEAMLVDSEDKIESDFEDILLGKGKLVFTLNEKSIEEIRAESAEYNSIQDNSRSEILGQEKVLNFDHVHSIHCDISNSNTSVNENLATSSLEVSSDQCQASLNINQTSDLIDELKNPLKSDIPQDAGSGDSSEREGIFSVPYSDNDSDSVFMDNSQEKSASIRTLESGDDFSYDRIHVHLDNNYNTFQYWRSPLPEVNIDFDIINGQPTNIHVVAKVKDEDSKKIYSSEMNVSISGSLKPRVDSVTDSLSGLSLHNSNIQTSLHSSVVTSDVERSGVRIHTASVSTVSDIADETVSHIGSTHVIGQHLGEQHLAIVGGVVQDLSNGSINFMDDLTSSVDFGLDDASLAQQQSIVPQLLLENYLGMVDPSRAQTVDGEITKHCAYNIPAVAYTLGRQNWHCIKNLYERLAQDMQWKVRRTLAFSMHELAMIVGEDITHTDLVPVFDGFLKDLDEVRIGVLKHLADIFKLLRPEVRLQYLSRTPEFMKTDNQRNWRFREELAEQLIQVCELFHCIDVVAHIVPLAMEMLTDKVAQVRLVALKLLCAILKKTYQDEERKLLTSICNDIIEKFATDERWLSRQTFAQLCYTILEDDSLPPDVFSRNFLPSLLALSVDPVPNVRLSLAKVMSQRILPLEYFTSQQNPYHEDLVHTQQSLQTDVDKDVRYFASQHPETDLSHAHDMVPV